MATQVGIGVSSQTGWNDCYWWLIEVVWLMSVSLVVALLSSLFPLPHPSIRPRPFVLLRPLLCLTFALLASSDHRLDETRLITIWKRHFRLLLKLIISIIEIEMIFYYFERQIKRFIAGYEVFYNGGCIGKLFGAVFFILVLVVIYWCFDLMIGDEMIFRVDVFGRQRQLFDA